MKVTSHYLKQFLFVKVSWYADSVQKLDFVIGQRPLKRNKRKPTCLTAIEQMDKNKSCVANDTKTTATATTIRAVFAVIALLQLS